MDLGLAGRVAVVTAASKGLGRATAQALSAEGAKLVLNARSADLLDDLAATMNDAVVVPGDITVNLVAPGLHATDRLVERGVTGRSGDPADVGQVVAFLCSEQANFINGTAVGVDGGAVTGLL